MEIVSPALLWVIVLIYFDNFKTCITAADIHSSESGQIGIHLSPQHSVGEYSNQPASDSIALKILSFAQNIGYELGKEYSPTQIFSPMSIVSVLAVLLLGSKGDSYKELSQLLGVDNESEFGLHSTQFHEVFYKLMMNLDMEISAFKNVPPVKWRNSKIPENLRNNVKPSRTPAEHIVKIANALFIQHGSTVNEDYMHAIQAIYRSKLAFLDFKNNGKVAKNYINSWANQNTFSKIRSIISEDISKDTNMIATNVLYFRGYWENDFFEAATSQSEFYPDGLTKPSIPVTMMATAGNFPYYESIENECRIIGLPYKGNLSTLYVLQPHNSTREKLRQMQIELSAQKIESLISNMVFRVAIVAFPKLHVKDSINLKDVITRMGASSLFSNTHNDFSVINTESQSSDLLSNRHSQLTVDSRSTPMVDRFNETPLIFSRFGEEEISDISLLERDMWNANMDNKTRMTQQSKTNFNKVGQPTRQRRQTTPFSLKDIRKMLNRLETLRWQNTAKNSDLYVKDIKHKVDLVINEQGTEAAAATVTSLKRSGPDILFRAETPFLLLLRHDVTKLPLFYGIVNDPSNIS